MSGTALERYEADVIGPPTMEEWSLIIEVAKTVAPTQFVPSGLRGNVPATAAAILTGRELKIGPMQALKQIAIIDGKATLSAELMVALVRREGHSFEVIHQDDHVCQVRGKRKDSGDEAEVTWTLARAEAAGLLSKANWQNYPEAMLWARAVSQLCRQLFPDLIAGIGYTPDEAGDDGQGGRQVVTFENVDEDDAAPTGEEGEVAENVEEAEVIDVEPVTVRDEAEVEEGLAVLEHMREAAEGAESPGGSDGAAGADPSASPPPATVSDAIAQAQAAAEGGRSVTPEETVPEPAAEVEVPPAASDDFNAEVVAQQVANNHDLLAQLGVDQLRKLATLKGVPQRGLRKDELIVKLLDAFRAPEANPAAMEAEDAAFDPSAATHVTTEPPPWETLDHTSKVARLDAALGVIAEQWPDPDWTPSAVVFSANKIWGLGAESLTEIPEQQLDKIWAAVPDEAKEVVGG